MPDYTFYTTQYLGDSISDEDFFRLSKRAAEQLVLYKRMYTVNVPDSNAEDMAICAMADAMNYYEAVQNGTGGAVSSATIGSVSVSYAGASGAVDVSQAAQERELYKCARRYLDIYRGCC